jgi:tRNA threonylcarbamoyladenosine biosynthesis protein TsaE
VIELISDLGGGKTTFVKGLAVGLDSSDHVTSPSFTVNKSYRGRLALEHFDFYRLSDPGMVGHTLGEVINDKKTVSVIEWAKTVHRFLPKNRLVVEINKLADESSRQIKISYPESLAYAVTGLGK